MATVIISCLVIMHHKNGPPLGRTPDPRTQRQGRGSHTLVDKAPERVHYVATLDRCHSPKHPPFATKPYGVRLSLCCTEDSRIYTSYCIPLPFCPSRSACYRCFTPPPLVSRARGSDEASDTGPTKLPHRITNYTAPVLYFIVSQ